MRMVTFEIASAEAICPFDGSVYAYSVRITVDQPAKIILIEDVATQVASYRSSELAAEEIAEALAHWAQSQGKASAALVEVRHEPKDGIVLTARSVVP